MSVLSAATISAVEQCLKMSGLLALLHTPHDPKQGMHNSKLDAHVESVMPQLPGISLWGGSYHAIAIKEDLIPYLKKNIAACNA